jgi:regulatory protein
MDNVTVTGCEAVGKGKIRVTFSDGITCLLYRGEARTYRIQEHASLSYQQYEALMTQTIGTRAKKRTMHLLEQMDRTEKQLRDKLAAGEYPERCIDDAISYVKKFHYLDDYRYACTYVQYRRERMSRGQLTQKLMQKGVARDLIARAIGEYDAEDETEQIRVLLEKRKYDPQNCDRKEFMRIYQYVLRRGFQSSDILKCMRSVPDKEWG